MLGSKDQLVPPTENIFWKALWTVSTYGIGHLNSYFQAEYLKWFSGDFSFSGLQ